MGIETMLLILKVTAIISGILAVAAAGFCIMIAIRTPPRQLKQRIAQLTPRAPEPKQEPDNRKRIVRETVDDGTRQKLEELFGKTEFQPIPGWKCKRRE